MKVIVGMSGGVDSAVAAYLLQQEGHEVIGMTLRTWESSDGKENRCCEIDDARQVARKLGIPYHVQNCLSDFTKEVTEPFVRDYRCGLTPNPCVICNRNVKWERMLQMAKILQADRVATGHYATLLKLENGRYTVKKSACTGKDQTYMLYRLTQEQLQATLMPLGNLQKDEVRRIADEAKLPVAAKKDSQEICFVPDGSYADYIIEHTGMIPQEGPFVDEEGNVLGTHKGIIFYTVGQRKGLGLALGYPAYVKRIRVKKNEVVIAKEESLYSTVIFCRDMNYLSICGLNRGESLSCKVKIRYHHEAQDAYVEGIAQDKVRIEFQDPVRAAAPGQSAVLYDENDCVIGGGIIEKEEETQDSR